MIRLARALAQAGVRVWLDVFELAPGDVWGPKLEAAIEAAEVVLACLGESGAGPWHARELEVAEKKGVDRLLVTLPGWRPEVGRLKLGKATAHSLHAGWEEGVKALSVYLRKRAPAQPAEGPAAPGGPFDGSPYPGIEAGFGPEHAAWFFGRERQTAELIGRLKADRWVWLIGNSGSGKSSLARAGVLPWWSRSFSPEGIATVFVPTSKATKDLTGALGRICEQAGKPLSQQDKAFLRTHPTEWSQRLRDDFGEDKQYRPILVIVDQAEQVFAARGLDGTCAEMLATLRALSEDKGLAVHVLVVLRADWLPRALDEPMTRDLFDHGATRLIVPGLDDASLRDAIRIPALRAGGSVADAVVDALVAGTSEHGLPMLQFVLREAWRDCASKTKCIESIGPRPFDDAIGRRVESIANLGDAQLDDLASALVRFDDREKPRRRFFARSALETHRLRERLESDLATLVEARVVVASSDDASGAGWQLSHESVIRGWGALARAIERRGDLLRRRAALSRLEHEYRASGEDESAFLRGRSLARYEELLEEPGLEPRLQSFLRASIERRQTEEQREHERVALLRDASLIVAARGMSELTMRAVLLREVELPHLSREWMSLATELLRGPLWSHRMLPLDTKSPCGLVAVESRGPTVAIELPEMHRGKSVLLIPQGSVDVPQAVVLWTPADDAVRLIAIDGPLAFLGFLDDGATLVALHESGRFCVWRLADIWSRFAREAGDGEPRAHGVLVGAERSLDLPGPVDHAAPIADGLLALCNGNVYRLDSTQASRVYTAHQAARIVPTKDGSRVAFVARGQEAAVPNSWADLEGRMSGNVLGAGPLVAISKQGHHLASIRALDEPEVVVEQLGEHRRVRRLRARAAVNAVAFAGEDTHLAIGDAEGTLEIWRLDSRLDHETQLVDAGGTLVHEQELDVGSHVEEFLGAKIVALEGHAGDRLLVRTTDGDVIVRGLHPRSLPLHFGKTTHGAVSRDGRWLLTAAPVRLWDLKRQPEPRAAWTPGPHHQQRVTEIADDDGLWVLMSRDSVARAAPPNDERERVVSYDRGPRARGRSHGSASVHGVRWKYDQTEGEEPRVIPLRRQCDPFYLRGFGERVAGMAITTDFDSALAWGDDGRVYHWSARDRTGVPLDGAADWKHAAFLADGKRVICVTTQGELQFWRLEPQAQCEWRAATSLRAPLGVGLDASETSVLARSADRAAVVAIGGATIHDVPATSASFVASGSVLAMTSDAIVELRRDGSSTQRRHLEVGDYARVVFAPNGRWVATKQRDLGPLIWATETDWAPDMIAGAVNVSHMHASADSATLYTGHEDGTVLAWPIELDAFAVRERLWRATPFVLTPEERRTVLLETPEDALARHRAALEHVRQAHGSRQPS